MANDLSTQYNVFAEQFVQGTNKYNNFSRKIYYDLLNFDKKNKRILDVGCGDGYDLEKFSNEGAIGYGIDSSKELVRLAQKRVVNGSVIEGLMENMPYENAFFDVVVSKYVLQISKDIPKVLNEMDRVLKTKGSLIYLTVHPLRQFLEKKKHPKDYFLQEIVESKFFNGSVIAHEPTHTMNEYLNPEFLTKYKITNFGEYGDFPSSEKINGDIYPCFFILKAEKI